MMASYIRLGASLLLPAIVMVKSYRKKSVSTSGAFWGCLVAVLLSYTSYAFSATLFTFFITSSIATNFKSQIKKKMEANFKEGGQRGFRQAFCNGAVPVLLTILYLREAGPSERPVNFQNNAKASMYAMGVLAVFAFGNADTWASELATVLSSSEPLLITTWRRVPVLTNGGITPIGTLLSAAGGLAVGLAHYLSVLIFSDDSWTHAPAQYPIVLFGGFAGLFGSLLDSYVGATLQYSGLNKEGKVISDPNQSVKHICGKNILGNSYVNFVITIILGVAAPTVAEYFWMLF